MMSLVAKYVPVWVEREHLIVGPTGDTSTCFSRKNLRNISLLFYRFVTCPLQLRHIRDLSTLVVGRELQELHKMPRPVGWPHGWCTWRQRHV